MARIKLKKKKQEQRRPKLRRKRKRVPLPADVQFASTVLAPSAEVLVHRCLGGEMSWVFMWKIRCHFCGFLFTTDEDDNPEITWDELLEKRQNEKPRKLAGFAGEVKRHCDGIIRGGGHPSLQVAKKGFGDVLVCSDGTTFTKKGRRWLEHARHTLHSA